MDENRLATEVIGAAIEVHKTLGPGLLESAYHDCLCHELSLRKLNFEREARIAVGYKGLLIDNAYRADLVVGGRLLVELKSVAKIESLHKAQLLTYLRLTGKKLGLLINFNTELVKHGVYRVANNLN
jgi:GxxExxY protein